MGQKWREILKDEFDSQYFKDLESFLEVEYREKTIFPAKNQVFNLFRNISYDAIKVVILGQDPYHGAGQGNGIAFSVNDGVPFPPSLRNIFKEIKMEYPNYEIPKSGNLMPWVKQGVFLLNAALTVEEGKANSHANRGWEKFTDAVIRKIGAKEEPVVFMLWGNSARNKKNLISNSKHLILESVHPSPLSASRGFFGCNHFLLADQFLIKSGIQPIKW